MSPSQVRQPKRRSRTLRRLRVLTRRHRLFHHLVGLPAAFLRDALLPLIGVVLALILFLLYERLTAGTKALLLWNAAAERVVVVGLLLALVALGTFAALRWR